jgi:hypothetical protein
MTTPSGHHAFDELAAGYALYSLDADEEQRFTAHLAHCAQCQQSVADHEHTAVRLADLAPQHEPPPRLRAGILAEAGHTPQRRAEPDREEPDAETSAVTDNAAPAERARPVTDIRSRAKSRSRTIFAAAAAVFLIAAVVFGVRANQLGHERDLQADKAAGIQQVLAQATRPGGHLVAFTKPAAPGGPAAPVAVLATSGQRATLMATGLGSTPADSVYVMWGLNGDRPAALGTFHISTDDPHPQVITLPPDKAGSTSFGISVEPGSTAPAKPSNVLALGKTT